jgi:hypothetical protein
MECEMDSLSGNDWDKCPKKCGLSSCLVETDDALD